MAHGKTQILKFSSAFIMQLLVAFFRENYEAYFSWLFTIAAMDY